MWIAALCLGDPSGTMLVTHDVHAAFFMRGLDESADFFICWHGRLASTSSRRVSRETPAAGLPSPAELRMKSKSGSQIFLWMPVLIDSVVATVIL